MLAQRRERGHTGWPAPGGKSAPATRGIPPDVLRRAEVSATLRWLENREKGFVTAASRKTRSALLRRFDRLNAPVVYPWSPSMKGTKRIHRLHRLAATLLRVRAQGFLASTWHYTKAIIWPAFAVLAAVPVVLRCWKAVHDRYGQTLREQWHDVIEAALRHGIFPTEYYYRRVYSTAARQDKSLYLSEREMIALLSAADRGADADRVDNLDRLYAACRLTGINTPRTVAVFTRGSIDVVGGGASTFLPEKDLFLRPEVWEYADHGEFWRWNAQAHNWSHGGRALSGNEMFKYMREKSVSRNYMLQECVLNHPELTRFSDGSLCTFRVATGLGPEGKAQVLFAACRFPGDDPAGDSPAAVDLISGIDVETGRLLPAFGEFVADGEFDNHPGTGAIITGGVIPHWKSIVAFANRVHKDITDVPFVGWEIALGVNGPILLDASTNWGFFPHVLPAETPFAEFCLYHLMRNRHEDLAIHALAPPFGSFQPMPEPVLDASAPAVSETETL